MTLEEKLATLANLPDDAMVTISIRLGDWYRARQAREETAGPEFVSSGKAAKLVGMSAAYWQKLAKRGALPGAVQGDGGQWRLPLAACRAHIRGAKKKPRGSVGPRLVATLTRGRPRVPKANA